MDISRSIYQANRLPVIKMNTMVIGVDRSVIEYIVLNQDLACSGVKGAVINMLLETLTSLYVSRLAVIATGNVWSSGL